MIKRAYQQLGLLAIICALGACALKKTSMIEKQSKIGLIGQQFSPCPSSPNCVSSMAHDKQHVIEPLAYEGFSKNDAKALLLSVIREFPRTHIKIEQDDYLHIEFTTALMRFVDDVEFYFPQEQTIIHVKSASRIGHSDFGTNRKRVENLRQAFYKRLSN